jgi:hypothetical protein
MDFIHRLVFEGTRRFGNWICFRPQVKGGAGEEDTYSVWPLRKSKSQSLDKCSDLHNCLNTYIFSLVSWGGVRLGPLGTSATNGLLYQPRITDDNESGSVTGMRIGR